MRQRSHYKVQEAREAAKAVLDQALPTGNTRFLVASFRSGSDPLETTSIYILNPGDVFAGFGGASQGLLVRKTASVVVRQESVAGTYDTEYTVNDAALWARIFRLAHRFGYQGG